METGVVQVAVGLNHSCALKSDYSVSCWGRNFTGQLGDGTQTDRLTAVTVTGLSGTATQIAAGTFHTCALVNSGVKCWGQNSFGQLGDNSTTFRINPVVVTGLSSGVQSIVAGSSHTCAILTSGDLKCWGKNTSGQLGIGSVTNALLPTPVTSISATAASVSAGDVHTCATLTSGVVKCWGIGFSGRLGDGTQNIDN